MSVACGWWTWSSLSCCTRNNAHTFSHCFTWFISTQQSDSRSLCVLRSEHVVLVSTSVLCAVVRLVQSSSLLDQLVHFLLRTQSLTHLLLQRCDHISDQVPSSPSTGAQQRLSACKSSQNQFLKTRSVSVSLSSDQCLCLCL